MLSVRFSAEPGSLRALRPLSLKIRCLFSNGSRKFHWNSTFSVRCEATSGRITQQEFTKMAWQGIVSSPEAAKENKHQIVETEHLMRSLLEQKNALARQIFAKVGVDNTRLLEALDKFIQRQPKVPGESAGSMLGWDLEALIQRARELKKECGDSFVSVEHLVLGFAQDQRFGKQLFKDFQISLQTLKSAIESIRRRQGIIDQGSCAFAAFFAQCESLLHQCAATRSLARTKRLHGHIVTSGLFFSERLRSKLAISYAFCGCVPVARKLFDELPDRTLFLWNTLIRMYVDNGLSSDALDMFSWMVNLGQCKPSNLTYPFVIKACGELSLFRVGIAIHGRISVVGLNLDAFVQNSLLAMYMNCSKMKAGKQVFDEMSERNVVAWNSIISGYVKNGCSKEAMMVFHEMIDAGVELDCATFVSVLPACGQMKELESGRKIHRLIEEGGLEDKIAAKNALVDMYVKCGSMDEAWLVFDKMMERDVVSWTSMINGYLCNGDARSALALCHKMQADGMKPNSITVASLLTCCASLSSLKEGRCLHCLSIRKNIDSDVIVETALIDMYAKCNRVEISLRVFGSTSKRRTVPWNAVLSGYISNGLAREAIEMFRKMLVERVEPNNATLNSLVPAYAILADLNQARNIHSYLVRSGFISRTEIVTAMVDIYSKCGSLEHAHKIFIDIPREHRDIIAWSVIIACHGMHGNGEIAVSLFDQMVQSGVNPNEVTFTSVLHACSHAGLVDEGLRLFKYMKEYHLSLGLDHYSCIVDLLGRGGRLEEAYHLIMTMSFQHNFAIWGALLGACVTHENVELGEMAAKHLFELEPENTGNYIQLAKIYSAVGRWRDAEKVRGMMSNIGLRKMPAHSLIEVGKV